MIVKNAIAVAVGCLVCALIGCAPSDRSAAVPAGTIRLKTYPGSTAVEALKLQGFVDVKETAGGKMCRSVSDVYEIDFWAWRNGETWEGTVCRTPTGRYTIESRRFALPPPNAGPE